MSAEITPAMVAELVRRLRREYPASMYSRVRGHAFVGSHAWATLDLWDTLDALESCRTELEQARIELEDERERVNVQREDIRTLRLEVQRLTEEARRSDAGRVVVPRAECPECGSTLLEWGISHTTDSSAPDGRLRMHEIQTVAHLGCQECSETVRTLDERGILDALRSSTNHDAQDAGEGRD